MEGARLTVLRARFLSIEWEPPPPMRRDLSKPRGPCGGLSIRSAPIIPNADQSSVRTPVRLIRGQYRRILPHVGGEERRDPIEHVVEHRDQAMPELRVGHELSRPAERRDRST